MAGSPRFRIHLGTHGYYLDSNLLVVSKLTGETPKCDGTDEICRRQRITAIVCDINDSPPHVERIVAIVGQ